MFLFVITLTSLQLPLLDISINFISPVKVVNFLCHFSN